MGVDSDGFSPDSEQADRLQDTFSEISESAKLRSELLQSATQKLRSGLSLLQEPVSKLSANASELSSEQQQIIGKLVQRLGHLEEITEQLGNISTLNIRNTELELTDVEIRTFLHRYLAIFETQAHQKNIGKSVDDFVGQRYSVLFRRGYRYNQPARL